MEVKMAEPAMEATHPHPVTVTVNERPVALPTDHVTGLEIKQAAIAQSVPIQLDFVLSEELGDKHTRIVGDNDRVTVNDRSRFLAIAPDDNS
jgi:hypothetical protein